MEPTIFLGLVTHRATRFPESAGTNGLVHRVAEELSTAGVDATVEIHDLDHHDETILPLTKGEVRASIQAEMALEERWRAFINPAKSRMMLRVFMATRRAYREMRLAPPWQTSEGASPSGAAMLRRLVNIELAHLHLLHRAQQAGSTWALIVEDDARLADPAAFASALGEFARRHEEGQPAYVNVSRSFSHERLDLQEHLTPIGSWDSTTRMLSSGLSLTNTVCAILYRGDFLSRLVPAMDAIPVSPVLPIDWKLNQALLNLLEAGDIGPGDCWFLDPAPILQGSMHEPSEANTAG